VFIAKTHQKTPKGLPSVTAFVKNASDQPIYNLELRWHRGSARCDEPDPQPLGALMPGIETNSTREYPAETDLAASGAVLAVRDAGGTTWMRRPDGGLTEQQ
jgi:hypothetical protein